MNKLLVILGPTATGKTDLALYLAKKLNGEIISCDSRQVYRELDIGTGKISNLESKSQRVKKGNGFWEVNGIKIWMYDVISPKIQYTVADYVKDAGRIIEDITRRGKLSIIVGGTGLYLKGLLEGLPNLEVPIDKRLRNKLQKLTLNRLQEKLKKFSSKGWNAMNYSDRQNPRRLIRVIELVLNQKLKIKMKNDKSKFKIEDRSILKIGLTAPREILYKRVDDRVVSRINQGMIDEVKNLHKKDLSFKRMRQLGLEYGILADYLEGKVRTKDELVKIMQRKIHGYVRRQLTWFKKEKDIYWFDITTFDYLDRVEKMVSDWYNS